VDMKHKLIHLHHLQNQQELYGEEIESSWNILKIFHQ
jgi:hypothetical protein